MSECTASRAGSAPGGLHDMYDPREHELTRPGARRASCLHRTPVSGRGCSGRRYGAVVTTRSHRCSFVSSCMVTTYIYTNGGCARCVNPFFCALRVFVQLQLSTLATCGCTHPLCSLSEAARRPDRDPEAHRPTIQEFNLDTLFNERSPLPSSAH